ncbi:MAG TPA: hypothetical protein VN829_10340 [Dongiaceae bacterium]|nr:hypothetical protein [Dongiaceae bacterium]
MVLLTVWSCVAAAQGQIAVQIGQNFTGSTDSFAWAPCPAGAVNEDYFVEFNMDTFAVYNKADGSVAETLSWSDFWTQAGLTLPSGYGRNTPRVVYDPTVQRWFVAEAGGATGATDKPDAALLAISATADPTGAWNGVSVATTPAGNDFSGAMNMGLDAGGVYLGSVAADITSGAAVGCTLLSFPKADLLSVPPIITNRTWFGVLSATDYGYNSKPVICLDGSEVGAVLATAGRGYPGDNNNDLFAYSIDNASGPGAATLGRSTPITVPEYTEPNNALQPDGSSNLVTWNAVFYANACAVKGVIYAVHPVQAGPHTAIGWYRVNATNYTLLESGTISDPSLDLYYPSIAANTNGVVVIAFNGSGTNTFVSCYAVVGQTVNGVTSFGNPIVLQAGSASYQNLDPSGDDLWGYYSTTCLDPADPNIFWTINAYAAGPSTWATQITQLLTSPSPTLSLARTAAGLTLSWPVTEAPFQLESAPSLPGSGTWAPVSAAAATNGATVSVTVPATNRAAFFRLVQGP